MSHKSRIHLVLLLAVISFSAIGASAQNYSGGKPDKTVEQQVFKKILGLPRYEVFDHIAFQINGGTVILTGKVYNAINKSSAENAVKRIDGVTSVVNNIEVLPPSPFDDRIRAETYRALNNSGGLSRYFWEVNPSVRIIVDHGRTSLEGFVSNRGDYNLMNVIARGVFGAFSVENNLVVDSGKAR